jgi:hypothetical protein
VVVGGRCRVGLWSRKRLATTVYDKNGRAGCCDECKEKKQLLEREDVGVKEQ